MICLISEILCACVHCVCVYACACMHVCACMCVCVCLCVCVSVYIFGNVCRNVCFDSMGDSRGIDLFTILSVPSHSCVTEEQRDIQQQQL